METDRCTWKEMTRGNKYSRELGLNSALLIYAFRNSLQIAFLTCAVDS